MAGRQSAAMDRAQHLVMVKGIWPAEAARQAGITVNTVYRSPWYKKYRATVKALAAQVQA